jgi:hypothetical protein
MDVVLVRRIVDQCDSFNGFSETLRQSTESFTAQKRNDQKYRQLDRPMTHRFLNGLSDNGQRLFQICQTESPKKIFPGHYKDYLDSVERP